MSAVAKFSKTDRKTATVKLYKKNLTLLVDQVNLSD